VYRQQREPRPKEAAGADFRTERQTARGASLLFFTQKFLHQIEIINLMRSMFILLACSILAHAETFSGTVVDVMCKDNQLATHPRQCAISCAKFGFGLKQPDGTFLKFDEKGNARALAALKRSTKAQDLKAQVTGSLEDGVLKVDSIRIH